METSNLVEFKLEHVENGEPPLLIEFAVCSGLNSNKPFGKEIAELESSIEQTQGKIDAINAEIDRLTNHADGIDYTIAVAAGIFTGLIDIFYVGDFSFESGVQWSNDKTNSFVQRVANLQGYSGTSIDGAVRFLEQKFPITADKATNIFGGA